MEPGDDELNEDDLFATDEEFEDDVVFTSRPQTHMSPDVRAGIQAPIWPDVLHEYPAATGFQVEHASPHGRTEVLGSVGLNVTHFDLVNKYFEAIPTGGTLLLTPTDNAGNPLMMRPKPVVLSPHHDAYKERAARLAAPSPGGAQLGGAAYYPGGGGDYSKLLEELRLERERADEREAQRRREQREELERLRQMEDKLQQQRLALAAETTERQADMTTKLMQIEAERSKEAIGMVKAANDQSTSQITAMFANMMAMQQQQAAADRQRYEQEKAEREAREERERIRERERARQEREDREAEEKRRRLAMEHDHRLAMERQQEYSRQQMEIQRQAFAQKNKEPLEETIKKALGYAKMLGMDIGDIKGLLSLGKGGGALETLADVFKTGIEAYKDVQKAAIEQGEDDEEQLALPDGQGLIPIQLDNGQTIYVTPQQLQEIQQAQAQLHAQQQAQQMQPPSVQNSMVPQGVPMGGPQPGMAQMVPANQPAPAQVPAPAPALPAKPAVDPNRIKALTKEQIRKGKAAARKIGGVLVKQSRRTSTDDEKIQAVADAVMENMAVGEYAMAAGLRGVFLEAGVEASIVDQSIDMLKKSEFAAIIEQMEIPWA